MNVWLVTTGSSDVQLMNGSDDRWNDWYPDIRKSLYRLPFKPTRINEEEDLYRLPARVLGLAYEQLPDEVKPLLTLPLLQGFTQELKAKEVVVDQIIVLMSDQENLFSEDDRESKRCPYWQDTCLLYPVLMDYFHQHFPEAEIKPLILKPQPSDQGLDDWDAVLGLVQREIAGLKFKPEPQTIYVSHQAGTPAISSAIQFTSLSRFGQRVKFLVSNERDANLTRVLDSSEYLKGIRKKEAEALLKSHNYSGIKDLLDSYLKDEKHQETKILLEAAIQWNFAEFGEFKNKLLELTQHPCLVKMVQERTQQKENWWWMGYEEAYLGVVRLKQENTVEAMFHSFRAVEGLASKWAVISYPGDVEDRDGMPVALLKASSKLPAFLLDKFRAMQAEKPQEMPEIKLYGNQLFTLLQETKKELKNNDDIQTLCNHARDNRNKLFHRLKGLNREMLFKAWGMNSDKSWEDRVLGCLNAISDQIQFKSLTKTSLMAQVHKELKKAIAHI